MEKYIFPCGCELPILGPPVGKSKIPRVKIDFYHLNLKCPGTWKLLQDGLTQGIFQVETQLGRQWCKKILPNAINDMAAIGSLVRPGCLRALTNGKSMTQHYADRKNNNEEVASFHPIIDECLKDTYNLLVYQEQAIAITVKAAGFSEAEADNLRRAIGKKIASEMAKVKTMFIEKAETFKVLTKEQAEEVFGWIEQSQRYSFNKCVAGATIVQTPNGYLTINEVKVGDMVLAPKTDKEDYYVKVVNKYENGVRDVVQFTTESGKTVQCTIDHKFLCEDGEVHPLWEIIEKNLKIMCQDD